MLPKSNKLCPIKAMPSCVTLVILPAAGAQGAQLTTLSALSLPLPEMPNLHVSPLDVLSFLLHNPPVTLAAAFGIAYLVTMPDLHFLRAYHTGVHTHCYLIANTC